MVAAALRWRLAIVFIGVFFAAWLLEVSAANAVFLALGLLLALHIAVILLTFLIAWPRASPGAIARECAACFTLFAAIQPFDRVFVVAAGQSPLLENKPPVLFVHGYACNRGFWWWLLRKLRWHGIRAAAVSLEPPHGGLDGMAEQLHRDIEAFAQETGPEPLVLVTHSMGGLVARAYLKRYGPARIAKLITLACPHHGTRLAWAGLGQNARELRPRSKWLAALAEGEAPSVPLLNVFSAGDNFVAPQTSARIEGCREVVLEQLGHLSFAFSPSVLKLLLAELDRPS
jgi:triacylglycerol lipase